MKKLMGLDLPRLMKPSNFNDFFVQNFFGHNKIVNNFDRREIVCCKSKKNARATTTKKNGAKRVRITLGESSSNFISPYFYDEGVAGVLKLKIGEDCNFVYGNFAHL